jgi:hypothetical protein
MASAATYDDDMFPYMQDALVSLADLDTEFDLRCSALDKLAVPESVRQRLRGRLDRGRTHARQPHVSLLADLHQGMTFSTMFRRCARTSAFSAENMITPSVGCSLMPFSRVPMISGWAVIREKPSHLFVELFATCEAAENEATSLGSEYLVKFGHQQVGTRSFIYGPVVPREASSGR